MHLCRVVVLWEDFDNLLNRGLKTSPIHEVLIDKSVLGWKEYELELLRDKNDNVAIICSIENFDPMGVHTGDSITVAPAQTLSDSTYQKMRSMAILMMRSIGNFSGGCNVQFAVSNDEKEEIIEKEGATKYSSTKDNDEKTPAKKGARKRTTTPVKK